MTVQKNMNEGFKFGIPSTVKRKKMKVVRKRFPGMFLSGEDPLDVKMNIGQVIISARGETGKLGPVSSLFCSD